MFSFLGTLDTIYYVVAELFLDPDFERKSDEGPRVVFRFQVQPQHPGEGKLVSLSLFSCALSIMFRTRIPSTSSGKLRSRPMASNASGSIHQDTSRKGKRSNRLLQHPSLSPLTDLPSTPEAETVRPIHIPHAAPVTTIRTTIPANLAPAAASGSSTKRPRSGLKIKQEPREQEIIEIFDSDEERAAPPRSRRRMQDYAPLLTATFDEDEASIRLRTAQVSSANLISGLSSTHPFTRPN